MQPLKSVSMTEKACVAALLPFLGQESLDEHPAVSAGVHWRAHVAALSTSAGLGLSEL